MNTIRINDQISYIEASEDPLSADVGIIRDGDVTWYYDVGCGERGLTRTEENSRIVLSHFHRDHTGNMDRLQDTAVFASKETCDHIRRGTVVRENVCLGGIRIFPLPSSHAKGCIGLEANETYAFVGDGLYSRFRDGYYIYNATLLKDEIEVLQKLKAPFLLVSHRKGMIRQREEALAELKEIYGKRVRNEPEIRIKAE